jgi:hypothetical protein
VTASSRQHTGLISNDYITDHHQRSQVRYDQGKKLLKAARKLADKTGDTLFIYHLASSGEQYVWSTDPELPQKFFRGEFQADGNLKVQNNCGQSSMKVDIVRPRTGPDVEATLGDFK